MAEGALFTLATDIVKLAGSITFSEIQLLRGAREELDSLKATVETIQAVLLDAEKQQWHNHQVKLWLGRLKDVMYDVQDLLDDVATENLRRKVTPGNKMSKVVRVFFSKSNQLAYRHKVAKKIQEFSKTLDRIANDNKLRLERHLSEETMIGRGKKPENFAPDKEIIGREEDKKKIKNFLFDSSSSQSVSSVAIVGKGGLGKTALARLVYNDEEVKEHFGIKTWVCVSDVFDVNSVIKEILKSANRLDLDNKTVDELQSLLHDTLEMKKYLLVLDDLWNEDRHKWLKLGDWLKDGLRGSKILVTTRSNIVATITDVKSYVHRLGCLSKDKSWNLFRKMAFGDGLESLDLELEETSRDIVRKCAGVPLAIKTIGGLLYGKKQDEWNRYRVKELPEIPEIDKVDNGIMQVLKFSYDRLPSCLKHCFAYCSLFPKNHLYEKNMMIHLWVAQGFIESCDGEDNLEEVAENYLSELLCRSFLDVARKGNDGEVLYFKMHDLMHDLAQKVAEGECKIINFEGGNNYRGIRHASFISKIFSEEKMVSLLKTSKVRTFLYLKGKSSVFNSTKVFSRCRHCRALGLVNGNIPLPPSSFSKLKQLRFLHISKNRSIQSMPNSIMDLVNLQILSVINCQNLRTFPKDLRKLVNLKYLSIDGCNSLSYLPPLSELPRLRTLILKQLNALEFLQQTSDLEQSNIIFPYLESLVLRSCSKLKGWCEGRPVMRAYQKHWSNNSWLSFPKLCSVKIRCCPQLNFMPPFLEVEYLEVDRMSMLETQLLPNRNWPLKAAVGSTVPFSKLKHLCLDCFELVPSTFETLLQLASNLKSVRLSYYELTSVSRGMQNLSMLQELEIDCYTLFDLSWQEDKHGIQWRFFTKLRVLKISYHWFLEALPDWIQHATALQSLEISCCTYLRSLPEWIENFSLLEKLVLYRCPSLTHLPSKMHKLTRLKELRILQCPSLEGRCLTDAHIPVIVWEGMNQND